MNLNRAIGESPLSYHKRLIYGKLVDRTLSDMSYSELSEYVYGKQYSDDVARRMMYGSRNTLELLDELTLSSMDGADALSEVELKIYELQKERQKLADNRNALSKLIRGRARQEELNEIISEAVRDANLHTLDYQPTEIAASDNDLLVSLNDLHYGANYTNYWGSYNSDVCKEMMRTYLSKVIEIAKTHKSENCIVWENGDAISGNIHRSLQITNKENVIQQIVGVSELIAEFLSELSKHFKTVRFVSVSGNHSRVESNKDLSMVEERLDDLIDWYLSARLQNFENIIIGADFKIDPTMYLIDIRGKKYCGVHGDFDGSATKVQSLQTLTGESLYAVLSAHLHHNKIDSVLGVKTVMAGSFLGMDDYCVQKRIYGYPEQMVCVCNEHGIVCSYDIKLR